ncbi:DUF5010 domain-containing protein [Candidatus Curtissbacteria bacterium]|nr:DUF5010 domain-containing protein [Candidatus Curtissbacteria bacterium]
MLKSFFKKLVRDRIFRIFLILLLVFSLIKTFSDNPKPEYPKPPIAADQINEKHVLSYFFYWYDLPKGYHDDYLVDHPIDKNASYENPDWFKNELLDMEEAGIDTALAVYWTKNESFSQVGLKNMVKAREILISEGKSPPKIALFLDTNAFGKLPKNKRNFLTDNGRQHFFSYIEDFYNEVPSEHRATIEGKPIIWLFGNYQELLVDQTAIDFVYSNFEKKFRVRPYIVRESTWNYARKMKLFGSYVDYQMPIKTDNYYGWGGAFLGTVDVGGVVVVGPGYDTRHIPDRLNEKFVEREDGSFYEKNLKKAIKTNKSLLAVETWNEFHEGSDIAHSQEYGKKYIEITKKYVDQFRKK